MRGAEMLVIVGLSVLLSAAIAACEQCMGGPPTDRNYACPAIASRGRPARCSTFGSWSAWWRRSNGAHSGLASGAPRTQRPTRSGPYCVHQPSP